MKSVYLILFLLIPAAMAKAQEGPTFTLGGSSLGATLEAGYRLGSGFGLRGVAGYASTDFSAEYNGAPLAGNATIGGFGLLADLYTGGGTRLTAGALAPRYEAQLALAGTLTANGATFNNVDISGSIDTVNRIAPMVAIGYERQFGKNWGVSADLGAVYTGGFSLRATDNSGQIPQTDLDSELADTNATLGQITILPFIKLGVSFSF